MGWRIPMKILIVDDELVSRTKSSKIVETLGHKPLLASDGEEGLAVWRAHRPDVVLTDWLMPGLDGPELCQRIREEEGSRYTYIVLITSKDALSDMSQGMDSGADDFIIKPFARQELISRLRPAQRIIDFLTRDVVIFSMAKLAESRDPETGGHLERIRHYSRVLAETLRKSGDYKDEVDSQFIETIFLTSPLHDIGKIGVPDHILLKPGRLDDAEFEIMKSHCDIGYKAINDSLKAFPKADYLKMSADIAYSHHEKFDGSGYPQGLHGSDIPLSARIVALADVFDALVCKRVYKNAMPIEVAKAILLESKGSHFEPDIVDAFLGCQEMFADILARYNME
jgi:putative two-component system response regulator